MRAFARAAEAQKLANYILSRKRTCKGESIGLNDYVAKTALRLMRLCVSDRNQRIAPMHVRFVRARARAHANANALGASQRAAASNRSSQ